MYFNAAKPFGIAETPIHDMIDVNKVGIKLEHNNKKYRKTPTIICVDDDEVYDRDQKTNLLLAITGNDQYNMSWHHTWEGEGTTFAIFYQFIERIINQLGHDHPGQSFCFTMDNLNIHHNPQILEIIAERGHQIVFRAPYGSCNGAIEYVFITIHSYLLYFHPNLETMDDLEDALETIITNDLGFYSRYFRHVGFLD